MKEQDYRFARRIVYHNGKALFSTDKKGMIPENVIKGYLKKEEENENYDGTKEFYR